LYFVVGAFAVHWALSHTGHVADVDGAMLAIREATGAATLWLFAAGFFAYSAWRLLGAIADVERDGRDLPGLAVRTGALIKGGAYAALGWDAVLLAQHGRGSPIGSHGAALATGFGPGILWVLGLAGLAFAGYECYRGYVGELSAYLNLSAVGRTARRWIVAISRIGITARGVVIGVVSVALIRAALHRASQPPDPAQSIRRAAASGPYPDLVLVAIGTGLIAYAIYLGVLARYRELSAS
jgi:hypothetical protein